MKSKFVSRSIESELESEEFFIDAHTQKASTTKKEDSMAFYELNSENESDDESFNV